jgi:superfamily I DNA/RNA helicase
MEALGEELILRALSEGQRVLALTFMHGSRRRLHQRLSEVAQLRGRFECVTIDSFAWRLVRRWRSLAGALGVGHLSDDAYDEQCDAAGLLLERPEVLSWIATSYPVVVIDEAQDLRPQRLRIVKALTFGTSVLVAADEFQCLESGLRPNPLVAWVRLNCRPETLEQVRRTTVQGILNAAAALRRGEPPASDGRFRIIPAQGLYVAAAALASAIKWRRGSEVAVIAPSLQGGFAASVVKRVCETACGRERHGPYRIVWEESDQDESGNLVHRLRLTDDETSESLRTKLSAVARTSVTRGVLSWIRDQSRIQGRDMFKRSEVEKIIRREVQQKHRRYEWRSNFMAMTVHQAKNREFDGVVVIWPYQVGGDAEHKRRLLYNAITRSKNWCSVIVQNPSVLESAPFA